MALDKARLKQAIHDKIVAKLGAATTDQTLLDFGDALADAIVTEILNATIVTTCGAGGGSGTIS